MGALRKTNLQIDNEQMTTKVSSNNLPVSKTRIYRLPDAWRTDEVIINGESISLLVSMSLLKTSPRKNFSYLTKTGA